MVLLNAFFLRFPTGCIAYFTYSYIRPTYLRGKATPLPSRVPPLVEGECDLLLVRVTHYQ